MGSTTGEDIINKVALENRQAGRDREEIKLEDLQDAIAQAVYERMTSRSTKRFFVWSTASCIFHTAILFPLSLFLDVFLSLQMASSTLASFSRSSSHALFLSCLWGDTTLNAALTLTSASEVTAPTETWWRKLARAWPTHLSRETTSPPPVVRPSPPK